MIRKLCIINPKWAVEASDLPNLSPVKLKAALRSQLCRLGSSEADGWLVAAFHSEFNQQDELFHGHFHGLVTGGMTAVVDGLRTLPTYRSARTTGVDGTVVDPIWLTRKPLTDVPYALSYVLKSYWPRYTEGPTGRRKTRLREPHHSHFLMWMDRYSLSDMTLLIKLRVGKNGIERSQTRT